MAINFSEESLNRVGIFLNFVAGILLTPSVIGLDRIKGIEDWAEKTMRRLQESSQRAVTEYEEVRSRQVSSVWWAGKRPGLTRFLGDIVESVVSALYITMLVVLPLGIGVWFITAWFVVVMTHAEGYRSLVVTLAVITLPWLVLWLIAIICFSIAMPTNSPSLLYAGTTFAVAGCWPLLIRFIPHSIRYLWAKLVFKIGKTVIARLEGEEKLLASMTVLGMLLFVAGNAIQFGATYVHEPVTARGAG